MLETFYNSFGFFGAIFIAFLGFAVFIFWVAGIAGIIFQPTLKNRTMKIVLCIIFPPYPFFWLFYDMYQQKKLMKEEE